MSAIIACLWQGLVVAWLTALLLRAGPRLNAATRHAIWWLALVTIMALPLAHFTALTGDLPGPALAPSVDADTPALLLPAPPDWLIACLGGAWLGTVLLAFARLVRAVCAVGVVKQRSLPVGEPVQRTLKLWTAVRGTGRASELRVSNELAGACALGLRGRPVILISTQLLGALEPDELDQIVMHEHAHLARYDDWLRMVQSVVTALFGLHPAVRFISARIDLEREAACDDRVVFQTGAADRYASCLASAADLARVRLPLSPGPILAPHASQAGGTLVTRVRRLLDPHTSRDAHLRWASTGASVLAFVTAVLISPAAQPLVIVLGAITGPPQMHAPPATGRTEWRSFAFAPSLPPVADDVPPVSRPSIPAASEKAAVTAPDAGLAIEQRLVAVDRQFSWTMPIGVATWLRQGPGEVSPTVVTRAPEPAGPLPSTPLAAWPIPKDADSPPAQSISREPDPYGDSAWKSAGYTGAVVGLGIVRAGVATGSGSRKAGTAVASFFSRAGKAVASSF